MIRTGTADIGEKYLAVIRKAASDYTREIFHKLREREYNPELMRLYVVVGGGCMIQNFGEYVTIVRDIFDFANTDFLSKYYWRIGNFMVFYFWWKMGII